MTNDQFEMLKRWINAIIDERLSHNSSDGGLIESVRLSKIEEEAKNVLIDAS